MTVHAMDPVDLFPYKQPQMRKVFGAFRQMLMDVYIGHGTRNANWAAMGHGVPLRPG
jgi:hypothetical protein